VPHRVIERNLRIRGLIGYVNREALFYRADRRRPTDTSHSTMGGFNVPENVQLTPDGNRKVVSELPMDFAREGINPIRLISPYSPYNRAEGESFQPLQRQRR
jgi:hypothetical protein